MPNLFFCAQKPHNVGDPLGGGQFGRGFDAYIFDAQTPSGAFCGWRLASEMIVEDVRKDRYPHMPSRLTCSYAFPDESEARRSMAASPGITLYLYEVELVDPAKSCHTVAFNLMSSVNRFAQHTPFLQNNRALADQYWSGKGITHPEVITESLLRVMRHVP